MSLRHILCEGPDDLTALRAIAMHAFRAQIDRTSEVNIAARVFHQNSACKPHALAVLRDAGLLAELDPLFA